LGVPGALSPNQEIGMFSKSKILLSMGLIFSQAMALDEFLPISPRVMQVDVGMIRSEIMGTYGEDWENDNVEALNNPLILPMQGKFGLSEGLEGSLALDYILEDRDSHSGLDRPVIALKYADTTLGAGGFLALTLPIGFEDVLLAGNYATFTLGAMYAKSWGRWGLLANTSYNYSTEDKDENKSDFVTVFAKPSCSIPFDWLNRNGQDFRVIWGMRYLFGFNTIVAGSSVDVTQHLFSVHPGGLYRLNKVFSGEMFLNFTLSGKNQPVSRGIEVKFHVSLDESLYNAGN
jgi:hypothetical protein